MANGYDGDEIWALFCRPGAVVVDQLKLNGKQGNKFVGIDWHRDASVTTWEALIRSMGGEGHL